MKTIWNSLLYFTPTGVIVSIFKPRQRPHGIVSLPVGAGKRKTGAVGTLLENLSSR